jgi:hypothetical protein
MTRHHLQMRVWWVVDLKHESPPRTRRSRLPNCYAAFFAALNFAQRARAAAAIRFLPAADIVRLGFGACCPFTFAHRAFCASAIFRREAADTIRFGWYVFWDIPVPFITRSANSCEPTRPRAG